jgi:hypothetical protein
MYYFFGLTEEEANLLRLYVDQPGYVDLHWVCCVDSIYILVSQAFDCFSLGLCPGDALELVLHCIQPIAFHIDVELIARFITVFNLDKFNLSALKFSIIL